MMRENLNFSVKVIQREQRVDVGFVGLSEYVLFIIRFVLDWIGVININNIWLIK